VGRGTSEVGGWTSKQQFRDYFKVLTHPVSGRGYFGSGVPFSVNLKTGYLERYFVLFMAKLAKETGYIHLFYPKLE